MPAEGFRIDVTNLRQNVRDLEELGVEVSDLKEAFGSIAAEGAEKAAEFAPKRSGVLAGDVRGNRAKSKAVVTAGRTTVPYAGPINYGWAARNIKGSFFMQKASDYMEPVAVEKLEAAINAAIVRRGLA